MHLLKQNTAATVLIGPLVDHLDGYTPETALTLAGLDELVLYKHDATAATSITGTTTFTHRAGGMYTATLSATDTNTTGRMTLYLRDNGVCLPAWKDYMVLPANVYDALVGGTDKLEVDVTQWSGTAAQLDATTSLPNVNANAISGDTAAATNLEADYDGTGYSKTASSTGLNAATCNKIADHILRRQLGNALASADGDTKAFRSLAGAVAKAVNKVAVASDTLTVYEGDDTTALGTQAVTTNPNANPIISLDTA